MQHDWQFPGTGSGATTTAGGRGQDAAPDRDRSTSRRSSGGSSTRRSRAELRAARAAARRRRRRSAIAVLIAVLLLGGAGVLALQVIRPLFDGLDQPAVVTDYPGPGHGTVEIVVEPGDSGRAIARTLADAGVVATADAFVRAARANPAAAGIQPGTYALRLEMSAEQAVSALLNPEYRVQLQVTIPEGHRAEQVLERISSVTGIPLAELEAAAEDPEAIGLPEVADGDLEGWLFPATYTFEPGTDATTILATMVSKMVQVLDEYDVPEDERQDLLTKASLVEREVRTDEDRPKVARAIENRLDQGMRLQIDASVAYGAGKPGTELTQQDLETDGPYNTYTTAGLPAGPIASPGRASIEAVLDPADGSWLFWVTVNLETGETLFADNYTDHQANVQRLREWQAQQQ